MKQSQKLVCRKKKALKLLLNYNLHMLIIHGSLNNRFCIPVLL